jgi:putative tricarboxylic transport membrane protein
VLVGTPGSPAAAPTAIEGYALAKEGQAARALSAAFLSSLCGGVIGAAIITLAIPIAGPLVLAFGTAELFMFTVVGVYYASSLLGGNVVRGLLAALLGLLLGTVGPAPAAAEFRFIFDQVYLMEGVSLVVLALGVFGVAEVVSMLALGGAISRTVVLGGGWREGARDVYRHRWLVVRGAVIGAVTGLMPAIGANASTWISYGQAVATSRDRTRFGKGDIRGLIAPESANNATVAADLVPTLLISVPGGPAAAVFMGALFFYGLYPGPRFVLDHQDLMFLIIWSLILSSVAGAALCFLITPLIARITRVRFALIAPPLLLVMVLGAAQSTQHFGDIAALMVFGLLGWVMKRGGWPRAPLLIGFVLATPMEKHFWLAVQLQGWRWLRSPGVLVLAGLILVPLAVRLVRAARRRTALAHGTVAPPPAVDARLRRQRTWFSVALGIGLVAVFAMALREALGLYPDSRLLPLLAIGPGLGLAIFQLVSDLAGWTAAEGSVGAEDAGVPEEERPRLPLRELTQMALLGLFVAAVAVVGFHVAALAFVVGTLVVRARMRPVWAVAYAVVLVVALDRMAMLMSMRLPAAWITW